MTPEEIRQLANQQTQTSYCMVPADERTQQRQRLREARTRADFYAAHLPAAEEFSDEAFITEWVNRLIQAAEILRKGDLLKYLDFPTNNANEQFGVEILKAAASGDRSRCDQLLKLGNTDPRNQGIYSDGIRFSVWEHMEKLACPPVDGVAAKYPLLASIGPKPDWLPFDWSEAGWPVEPTVEAILQLVDWLLLSFQVYSNTPAKKRALQQNGNYRNTLRDVRNLLLILRERGIAKIDFPAFPNDVDEEMFLDRLRELRLKLIEESRDTDAGASGNRSNGRNRKASKQAPRTGNKELFIAALLEHHQFQPDGNGSCGNFEPVKVRDLAVTTGIPRSTVSRLFNEHFPGGKNKKGHGVYLAHCESGNITTLLKHLDNPGELSRLLASPGELAARNEDDD